jgi:hypothetical protein
VETTFDVRIHETEVYKGSKTTTYWVRWKVAGRRFKEPFKQKALADSFRSALTAAARNGEAFVVVSGRPVSMHRDTREMSCYELACSYVDAKWPARSGDDPQDHRGGVDCGCPTPVCPDEGKARRPGHSYGAPSLGVQHASP